MMAQTKLNAYASLMSYDSKTAAAKLQEEMKPGMKQVYGRSNCKTEKMNGRGKIRVWLLDLPSDADKTAVLAILSQALTSARNPQEIVSIMLTFLSTISRHNTNNLSELEQDNLVEGIRHDKTTLERALEHVCATLGVDRKTCTRTPIMAISHISLQFLFIGKNIGSGLPSDYYQNCIKGIRRETGDPEETADLNEKMYPPMETQVQFNSYIRSCPTMRRVIIQLLTNSTDAIAEPDDGAVRYVLKLLRWAELDHLVLIDRYLVKPNSPILQLPELQPELQILKTFYEYLGTVHERWRPYIKLSTWKTSVLGCTNREHYPLTTAAAKLAEKIQPPINTGEFSLAEIQGVPFGFLDRVERILKRLTLVEEGRKSEEPSSLVK